MTKSVFQKNVFNAYFFKSLTHIPSAYMEGTGLLNLTAVSYQEAFRMFWLHFWGAVMTSIRTVSG